ncbi:MAG TPA: hypothetical protein VLU43_01105, partial [Anaeromyxobacteraceae bacterium]|nr:hypothetical protein [Anaeromyxobacteraceae bacterium]
MAEVKPTASAGGAAEPRHGTGFELRLERAGVSVRLAGQPIAAGLRLDALVLSVPDVRFPFDVGQGAGQFRHRLSDLVRLDATAEPALVTEALARVDLAALGLAAVEIALRDGFAELAGRIAGGPSFTMKAGLLPAAGEAVAVVLYAARLYGPAPVAAAALPHLAARAISGTGLSPDPLPSLLRRVLAPRGWKMPRSSAARLARAVVRPDGARIAWDRDQAGPAELSGDPDLLATDEGARTFAAAEAHLARGDASAARDAYLAAGPAAASHPFAAERLLSLLCLEDRFHDEALDLASEWLSRRPDFAPALAAEAWVRIARGEGARAARALATLAAASAARGEGLAALAAAEAAFPLAGGERDAAQRAIDAALAVRRDHVPALRALRELATATGDREALLRANRRLVAYAPADAEKARAHAELGELLLATDAPAARLHLDQALRLAPEDPDALAALARACDAAGEHLRAVRARDRLREIFLARGDRAAAARAALDAGELWETRLHHDENALLRYREAAELAPGDPGAHARAAAAAERLGHWTEAADQHAAVLALLDTRAPGAGDLAARTHLALADVAERRLSDPAGAATHLEAAVALAPDPAALRRLVALYRTLGRPGELLAALDRLAPAVDGARDRAALLAEAGALALDPLGRPDAARSRFAAALALDEGCRPALEGLADLAAARGDAQAERDALTRLVPLAADREEEARLQDRLAAACEHAGDLGGASRAIATARRAAPSLPRLAEALRLARRGDPALVAGLLAEHAAALQASGDAARASAAWLERSRLVAAEPKLALAAIAEARALSPGDPAVLRAQADLAERAGDPLLALGALRALLAGAPPDAAALELRAARAALQGGEPTAAREHADRARGAGAAGADEILADVLDRTGDDAGRAELLERLERHAEAAVLWERAGDPGRARSALEAAARDPLLALDALPKLAELRLAGGDGAGAAEALLRLGQLTGGRDGALLALRAHALAPESGALDAAVAADPDFAPARAERAQRSGAEPRTALDDAEAALAGDGLAPEQRPAMLG